MHDFDLLCPETVSEAVALKKKLGSGSVFLAGGTNLLYLMKRGVRKPSTLINLKGIKGLDSITYNSERGLRIGCLVKISELQKAPRVLEDYPILDSCAGRIASPQIRNAATVGGNLSQEVWCWYLTEGFDCWMNGGRHCYAPGGDNRYHHSVAGGYICLAVHPSDLATTFFALDSRILVAGDDRVREMGIDELLPGFTMVEGRLKQNALKNYELLTEVVVPPLKPGTRTIFRKYAARESFDFALSSVAIALKLNDSNRCEDVRVVLGGVATRPYRSVNVESALRGNTLTRDAIEKASAMPFGREIPLTMNSYRIRLTKELIRSALLELAMPSETSLPQAGSENSFASL